MNQSKISNFKGEYAFLSNFYEAQVNIDGIIYKNSEAAFQAQKCRDQNERLRFTEMTALEAKRFGKKSKSATRLGKRKSKHYERYRGRKIQSASRVSAEAFRNRRCLSGRRKYLG